MQTVARAVSPAKGSNGKYRVINTQFASSLFYSLHTHTSTIRRQPRRPPLPLRRRHQHRRRDLRGQMHHPPSSFPAPIPYYPDGAETRVEVIEDGHGAGHVEAPNRLGRLCDDLGVGVSIDD